jgi:hypothetical protein
MMSSFVTSTSRAPAPSSRAPASSSRTPPSTSPSGGGGVEASVARLVGGFARASGGGTHVLMWEWWV